MEVAHARRLRRLRSYLTSSHWQRCLTMGSALFSLIPLTISLMTRWSSS